MIRPGLIDLPVRFPFLWLSYRDIAVARKKKRGETGRGGREEEGKEKEEGEEGEAGKKDTRITQTL